MTDFEKFHLAAHEKMERSLEKLFENIEELQAFKWRILASAKMTAFLVGGVCGGVTLMASVALVYYTRHT